MYLHSSNIKFGLQVNPCSKKYSAHCFDPLCIDKVSNLDFLFSSIREENCDILFLNSLIWSSNTLLSRALYNLSGNLFHLSFLLSFDRLFLVFPI